MYQPNASDSPKISPEFASRLSRLDPRQKVRAIVLLAIPKTESFTRPQRQTAMKLARESGTQALEKIRSIIDRFQGRLLAESPDLLGSIPVEIDSAGIRALVESESVRAVLEDQSISLEHRF